MPLTVMRHEGREEGLTQWLEGAARDLVCRSDEEWALTVDDGPGGLALVVTGPPRAGCAMWDAEVVREGGDGRWRYRRTLATTLRSTHALGAAIRDLVWQPFEFAPNPVARLDAALARELERVVLEGLRDQPPEPLLVRFGIWNGEEDGPRYLCKVESVPSAGVDTAPGWRWWSPLVRTPTELSAHFQEAIRSRGRRRAVAGLGPDRQFWGWGAAWQAGA